MSDNLMETITELEELNNMDSIENSFDIISGSGIEVTKQQDNYIISSNSAGVLVDDLGDLSAGDTIHDALELILEKISDSAGIQSGRIIRTTAEGIDVDFPDVKDLLENTMYLRLVLNNGKPLHISAFEIDRALDTVARLNNDKADQSAVDELAAALEGKASAMQLTLLNSDIASKADKTTVSSLSRLVDDKADKKYVDEITSNLETNTTENINSLTKSVNTKADSEYVNSLALAIEDKANIDAVIKLQEDVKALKHTLESLSSTAAITAIQNQINSLNSEIQRRLTIDDLRLLENKTNNLSNDIEGHEERITSLETNIVNKASVAYVQRNIGELNSVISNVAASVDNKADKASVAKKASQEDFNILAKNIVKLTDSTNTNAEKLDKYQTDIKKELNEKVSKKSIEKLSNKLVDSLNTKVDKTALTESINDLNKKIDTIDIETPINEVKKDLHDVEVKLNNKYSTINSNVTAHEKKIKQQDKQITSLKETDEKLNKLASNEWIRVMTPEDYDRLPSNPNYADGTKNPTAKQPNVLYMLVKYNRPVALYIGTVLIAKAQENGSISFVYEFPIIF